VNAINFTSIDYFQSFSQSLTIDYFLLFSLCSQSRICQCSIVTSQFRPSVQHARGPRQNYCTQLCDVSDWAGVFVCGRFGDVAAICTGMWSRSRRLGLETHRRLVSSFNVSCLSLHLYHVYHAPVTVNTYQKRLTITPLHGLIFGARSTVTIAISSVGYVFCHKIVSDQVDARLSQRQ